MSDSLDHMNHSTPGLPVHHQLPESTQTHVHWISDAIQPSHPCLSPSLSALNLSQHQGLFKWVSSSHQVAKVLEFQLQHQSFQWIFRTDYFRMDWLDLLAVQGTLKSLLQNNSSKSSILLSSAFLTVQFSHPYMITGKSIALTRWTLVGKVIRTLKYWFNSLWLERYCGSKSVELNTPGKKMPRNWHGQRNKGRVCLCYTKKAGKSYGRKRCGGMGQGVELWLYWPSSQCRAGEDTRQERGYGCIRKGHSILYSNWVAENSF